MAEKLQGYARNNIIIGYLAVLLTSIEKCKPIHRQVFCTFLTHWFSFYISWSDFKKCTFQFFLHYCYCVSPLMTKPVYWFGTGSLTNTWGFQIHHYISSWSLAPFLEYGIFQEELNVVRCLLLSDYY